MINVVGAGEDPENLTPATFYNFTPKQKQAPAPVMPAAQPIQSVPVATPVVTAPVIAPAVAPALAEPETPVEPETPQAPPPKPPKKAKNLLLAGIVGLLVLSIGIGASVYLGQTNQDVRQQASTTFEDQTVVPTPRPTIALEPTAEPTTDPKPTQPVLDGVETLALAPTLTPTPILIDTAEFCGQSCVTDENCQNPTHSCSAGTCKLSSNPISVSCKTPSGSTQIQWDESQEVREYSPYATPSGETPQSGPADWLHYWWIGLGALGIGATLLLFL